MDNDYSKREVDAIVTNINESLKRIEAQTIKHNGRLSKVERYLLVVGCVTGTLFAMSGNEFVRFISALLF